ncbi:FAD-binding oxidoreductase [Actinomadura hibisca]|uniref:FAD-binding oxidoreductase n=1 Tax=Actinomadura hibisca TaxID=68565 RepID=UPI00082F8227|nr:FAD-binding oxidoreductase [Actinomadura hibisca]
MTAPIDSLAKVCGDVRAAGPEDGVLGAVPRLVAAPATVAEAAEVMRAAAELGLAVVPRGMETRLDWGLPPERCDLLVDTARLDRIVEHEAGDLVVKAEAGVRLGDLAAALAEHGQRLALDSPLPGATVGGTVATGSAGPLRLLYGSPRDLVIGLTIVRADGRIARSGGKVVKNVAGYDLGRLFAGSWGTLGLIVEATFRLHPMPAAAAYVSTVVPDPAAAHEAVQSVLHSPVAPSAVECAATPDGIAVGALLEGVPDGVTARSGQVNDLFGGGARVEQEPPAWWGGYPDGTTLIEITAPPTALAHADWLTGSATWSAAGRGLLGLPGDLTPERAAETLEGLRAALAPHKGGAVVRYAPEPVRDALDVWGPVPALSLMRRVKDQFDPERRLSPGRFVGGI